MDKQEEINRGRVEITMPQPVFTVEEETTFSELEDSFFGLRRKEWEIEGKADLAIKGALFNMLPILFVAVVVAYYDEFKPEVPKQLVKWSCVSLIASSVISIGFAFRRLLKLKGPSLSLIRNIPEFKENIRVGTFDRCKTH